MLTQTEPELAEEESLLLLWKDAVGKVFKLTSKSYGVRTVTYTQVKAVKETETPGAFEIDVSCAEIIARVTNSKRGHSSVCKDGVLHQNEESIITPNSFGEECRLQEFEKISGAILAHATMHLDLVTQSNPLEEGTIEAPIDLPHLKLTDMEASLVRTSPFLIKDIYLLSANSRKAAFDAITQELQRAARNSRLTDACDPIYVAQKNAAVISLRNKLSSSAPESTAANYNSTSAATAKPIMSVQKREPTVREHEPRGPEVVPPETNAGAPASRRPGLSLLEKDSLALAQLGKSSAASLSWEVQNPSKEGAVFRIGKVCGLLEFVRWAHLTGRAVSEQESAGKKARTYFGGSEASYTGPDKEGIYPQFRPE